MDIIKFVIEKCTDDNKNVIINKLDSNKNTSLHLACGKKDNDNVVRFLIENGANLTLKNSAGQTPRQVAEKNNKQYVKIFEEFTEQECFICHKTHKPISFYTTPCQHKFGVLCIVERGLQQKFEKTDFTCQTCNQKLNLEDIEHQYDSTHWNGMSWDDLRAKAKENLGKKFEKVKEELQKLYNIKYRSLQENETLKKLNDKYKTEIKVLDKLETCVLCQLDERENIYTTPCGHKFCVKCITKVGWVAKLGYGYLGSRNFVCPTCRAQLNLNDIKTWYEQKYGALEWQTLETKAEREVRDEHEVGH